MTESYIKLARILRIQSEALFELDKKMSEISGRSGVLDKVFEENNRLVKEALKSLDMKENANAEEIYLALAKRLKEFEIRLYDYLGKPDLMEMSKHCGRLCEVALKLNNPSKGFFIKKEKAIQMLEKFPPDNLLEHFGIKTVRELVEQKGFSSVYSSLRFAQSTEWMHKFFDEAYNDLTPDDFEEREVEIKVLETEWLKVAERFLKKKYHNLSHLKELGIIFIVPIEVNDTGETLRLFLLMLHYLNEVPYYSKLFRKIAGEGGFVDKLKSLLRGDVLDVSETNNLISESDWLIIQRYLAKDDPEDRRLFMPHVNPEVEHWRKAGNDLSKIASIAKELDDPYIRIANSMDFAGDYFKNNGGEELRSFSLIDSIMALVSRGEIKYVYHQQEALWNKIFIGYMGQEKTEEMMERNLINGFIKL
ncbi:MAG: hypothetical protein Q8Q06_02730 [bacterium]|nr:hypothetical protein [bacterium]